MASAEELERGSCFRYNNEILRVVRKEIVTVGTHSHSKLKIFARNIFGGGEKTLTLAHQDKVDILDIKQKMGQLLSKNGNKAQVMDSHTYETFDAEIIEGVVDKVNENDNVIFLEVEGKFFVMDKGR